ncbi:uncharacterized protein [Branchiostoma lanceolatum]|uniref:uncharacterized protein n=1 Tax=Branchiostoma lanceolatum TaxID=7740 RepID=UPI003454160C
MVDDNECPNGGRGPCDQTCTNTDGSYICTCSTGYRLNSDGHACDLVQCPTLTAPENGAVTGGNSYQDEVQFTCNHGYQLIGDSSRTCQADGTWTGADPACIGPSDITPTMLQTQAVSSTEIRLTWSLPGHINLVTGYTISVQPRGTTDVTSIGVGQSDSPSSTVHNLDSYTHYEFWIVAFIGDFLSGRSEIVNQRTQAGVPTVPRIVRLTNLSWSELRVTWNDPDNFVGPNRGYVIKLYTTESADDGNEVAQNSTEYSFIGLEAATSYTVEVRANNGRNTGPPGNATARTSDGFPSSPTNIRRQEEDTHCNISWSSPAVPRGDVIGYKVHIQGHYKTDDGGRQEGEYVLKSTTSKSIRLMKSTKTEILDLLPNSVYTINVTGFTYTGEGDFSQTVNCTVPPGKPSEPELPVLPDGTKIDSTSFPLQVRPSSGRNGPIGCYHLVVVKSISADNLPDPEMLQPYGTLEEAKDSRDGNIAYITMALTPEAVGESTTVTVGDGRVTSCKPQQGGRKRRALTSDDVYNQEYTNSPLEPDSSYTTSVRAYGPNDGEQPYFSASQYMEPVSTVTTRERSATTSHTLQAGLIGLGAVSALLLVALVVSVAAVFVLKRRLAKSKREANGTTVQNDAFDDTYYTDTRTNRANDDGTYCDVINDDNTKRGGANQDGEYDMPDVGDEGAYQTLDPRTLEKENNEYQKLAKKRVLKHL